MREKTAAGIILYNPDICRMNQNLAAIINQVDYVLLIDNGSQNKADIENALPKSEKIIIQHSNKNNGIAWALNQIFRMSAQYGIQWILTLDQDSVCPPDIINDYRRYLCATGAEATKAKTSSADTHIGILCPTIVDKNAGVIEGGSDEPAPIKRCITSGSFTSCAAWKAVRGFDEKMFIDGVDFDFCDRIRKAGYRIIRVGSIRLTHELGKMTAHRFLFTTVKVQNHVAKRKYYIVRNRFYLARKERNVPDLLRSFFFVIKFSATIVLFEKGRRAKLHAVFRGMRDGLRMPCR